MPDSASDQGSNPIERENRLLKRRLLRTEQSLQLLQEIQRGNSHLQASLLRQIEAEKEKSDRLLRNILPEAVISRLNRGAETIADSIDCASVVFSDLVGFTPISASMTAAELVAALNALYTDFDAAALRLGIEKIKTIGDAYLAAAGLSGDEPGHARTAVGFALEVRDIVRAHAGHQAGRWRMRTGVHTGSLTAGVIGQHKFAYDIWGDTVNVASRIQSVCPPDEVLVSADTAALLGSDFRLLDARQVELKGRGLYKVFRVDRPS